MRSPTASREMCFGIASKLEGSFFCIWSMEFLLIFRFTRKRYSVSECLPYLFWCWHFFFWGRYCYAVQNCRKQIRLMDLRSATWAALIDRALSVGSQGPFNDWGICRAVCQNIITYCGKKISFPVAWSTSSSCYLSAGQLGTAREHSRIGFIYFESGRHRWHH